MNVDDQLFHEERVRLEALVLAVEFTKDNDVFTGNSRLDGTVSTAKRYEKYIREGS